jgi:hypothetical protein
MAVAEATGYIVQGMVIEKPCPELAGHDAGDCQFAGARPAVEMNDHGRHTGFWGSVSQRVVVKTWGLGVAAIPRKDEHADHQAGNWPAEKSATPSIIAAVNIARLTSMKAEAKPRSALLFLVMAESRSGPRDRQ